MTTDDMDAVQALVDRVREEPGWSVGKTVGGLTRLTNTRTTRSVLAPRADGVLTLENFEQALRDIGFPVDPPEVVRFSTPTPAVPTAEELRRQRDEVKDVIKAERKAAKKEKTTVEKNPALDPPFTPPSVTVPPAAPGSARNPFFFPGLASYEEDEPQEEEVDRSAETGALAGYRSEEVLVTPEMAARWLEHIQCRQRNFSPANANKWLAAMKRGEWRMNPSDSIVFDEHVFDKEGNPLPHGCLINGQHRLWAVLMLPQDAIAQYYPDGVPFKATYGFPSKDAHIFDTGRSRTAGDVLTVAGFMGWGNLQSGALRLVLRWKQSFEPGGNKAWPTWKGTEYSHDQLRAAVEGDLRELPKFAPVASLLYSSKINKGAGMALGYLLERYNPTGGGLGKDGAFILSNPSGDPDYTKSKPNLEFVNGVAGKAPLDNGDPRMALMRYAMNGAELGRGNPGAGATHLVHALRRYADWQLGKDVRLSQADTKTPAPVVWQPGMGWYPNRSEDGGSYTELRFPLR